MSGLLSMPSLRHIHVSHTLYEIGLEVRIISGLLGVSPLWDVHVSHTVSEVVVKGEVTSGLLGTSSLPQHPLSKELLFPPELHI